MRGLIEFVGTLFYVAIFARVVLSWFPNARSHPLVQMVYLVTEPILAPVRRFVPTFGALDLSPMIALILVLIVQQVLLALLT
ncbi:MAG: YggT family protein [Chloroflexi bacterium]|nr:YggT family protein [Chloroflexota bacterium]